MIIFTAFWTQSAPQNNDDLCSQCSHDTEVQKIVSDQEWATTAIFFNHRVELKKQTALPPWGLWLFQSCQPGQAFTGGTNRSGARSWLHQPRCQYVTYVISERFFTHRWSSIQKTDCTSKINSVVKPIMNCHIM